MKLGKILVTNTKRKKKNETISNTKEENIVLTFTVIKNYTSASSII